MLGWFIGFVIFPADHLLALLATDVSDNMLACCHVAIDGLACHDIDDSVEEERFAVLAAKVSANYLIVVCKMGLASLASIDPLGI